MIVTGSAFADVPPAKSLDYTNINGTLQPAADLCRRRVDQLRKTAGLASPAVR